jgi:HSP20 family molecular chaperone IbpA
MPLRYRRVTYRYTTAGSNVDQLMRRIWELNRSQAWALPAAGLARARWRPPTDVLEGPSGLLVKVELAGMREDDIEVTLFDDVLVVAGRRAEEYPEQIDCHSQECRYHESAIQYGEFQAEVYLPLAVDADQVVARYDRGFLYITLPRRRAQS